TFWPGLDEGAGEPLLSRIGHRIRGAVAVGTSHALGAVPALVVTVAALVVCAAGLVHVHLALTPVRGLAPDAPVAEAAKQAALGFTPGIVAPTELAVRGRGIAARQAALKGFARRLGGQPEVG